MSSVFSSCFQEAAYDSCLHDIWKLFEEVNTKNIGLLAKCWASEVPVGYGGINVFSTSMKSAWIPKTKRQESTLCPQPHSPTSPMQVSLHSNYTLHD